MVLHYDACSVGTTDNQPKRREHRKLSVTRSICLRCRIRVSEYVIFPCFSLQTVHIQRHQELLNDSVSRYSVDEVASTMSSCQHHQQTCLTSY